MNIIETANKRSHCEPLAFCSRQKHFDLLTWLFGMGTHTNTKIIKKIKQN